jgi:hypothetical protein
VAEEISVGMAGYKGGNANESDGEMSLDRGAIGGCAVIRDWEMGEPGMAGSDSHCKALKESQ